MTPLAGARALTFFAAAVVVGAGSAGADESACRTALEDCVAACRADCAPADVGCADACADSSCGVLFQTCMSNIGGSDGAVPEAMAAPAPAVQSLEIGAAEPLVGRIHFLEPREAEPDALYYGYILVGSAVSPPRREALARAVACRLDALPTAADADEVDRLGLITVPALRPAGRREVTPEQVLAAYDLPRAQRWLRAAGFAAGQDFNPATAIVFVGSRTPRARQMDAVALPGPTEAEDPVIADASTLSARYVEAWAIRVIDGVEAGRVRSRQDLQALMEANSWIEWAATPVASLFRITPAQASAPPTIQCD